MKRLPCNAHRPTPLDSFVLIQLLPHLFDVLALLLGLLSILPCPLEALGAQTHVYFVLCVGAVAGDFPDEAAGVALVEGSDDVSAVCRRGGLVKV
jgi:hypothetical protein